MFHRDKSKKRTSPPPALNISDSIESKSLPSAPPTSKKSPGKTKKRDNSLNKEKKQHTSKSPNKNKDKPKTKEKSPRPHHSRDKSKVKGKDSPKADKTQLKLRDRSPLKDKLKKKDDVLQQTKEKTKEKKDILKNKVENSKQESKVNKESPEITKKRKRIVKKDTQNTMHKKVNKDAMNMESSTTSTPLGSPSQLASSDTAESDTQSSDDQLRLINKINIPKRQHKQKTAKQDFKPKLEKKNSRPKTKEYEQLETSSDEENIFKATATRNIHLPKLNPLETEFLQLVTDDDVEAVKVFLSKYPKLNINCVNFQGVSALRLAIQNENEDMVELLLDKRNIDISDTVLHAVKENNLKILVMLLDAQKSISPGLEFAGATHSTEFPDHVTPLILAAQEGHYEIVDLLVARGHTIARPHPPDCGCADCKASLANDDPLDACSTRLSLYRAIASPAYLVHVSSDPILSAFRLTAELADNANAFRQLAAAYLELKDNVSAFAVDIIGCCRTSQEVEVILKQNAGSRGRRHFILPRLLMAVDYKQKEFVAHPNTQQVLESYWSGSWYSWRSKKPLLKAFIVISRLFVTPAILVLSLVLPNSRLLKHWKIPLNKLITHAAAYFLFLLVILYISNQDRSEEKRGPPETGAEPILVLYVCGYTWSAARMCVMQGPRRFFSEMWNWGEIIMLLLFGITFVLWLAAAIDVNINDKEDLERKFWNQYDPTLLAEGTFCLATICAYFRLMYLCQLNYHLGPLQVSLGKMTVDIYKYITVFAILMLSFAAGLARFYQYYDGMVYEDEFGMKTVQVSSFTSLTDTLNTLFWAIFCMAPLESADVIIENSKDPNHPSEKFENRHAFTERIGYVCFACFEVMSVIVVLNMLIATMSNTFQRVIDNVAIEWTFGKTEVYIDYISQTTLPSPYNLIPTASGIRSIVEWFRIIVTRPPGLYARWSPSFCCYIERDVEANIEKEYPTLMSVLIQRYFRDKQSILVGGTSVEGEIEALRRDVTSLKTTLEKQFGK